MRLVHAAIVEMTIDGYPVSNPIGFPGRQVEIGIFNAFAPMVHLGALQSVAEPARPRAARRHRRAVRGRHVPRARSSSRQAGAVFVDIGGGTTDVALVRGGGIEGTKMLALGGRAFTKSLAERLDLPFPRAEALKVDYARGLDDRRARRRSARSWARTSRSGRRASSW